MNPSYRQSINKVLLQHAHACKQVEEEKIRLQAAEETITNSLSAQVLVQKVAEAVQRQAHKRIASVVSKCLTAVFGEDAYQFKIDFKQLRGKTEAHLLFERDGKELEPLEASGGGVVDLASFALRIACLVLVQPLLRRLIIADEPFRFLSIEYRPAVKTMLQTLAKEMQIQMVLVTHSRELICGKVVEINGI